MSKLEVSMESILRPMMVSLISLTREDSADPRKTWYKTCTMESRR